MSGLILVSTIVVAMGTGVLSGFAVLNLFFYALSRNRLERAPLTKAVPAH